MNNQKRKRILNGLMVASIAVIMISGIITVGNLKGWFEKSTQSSIMQEFGIGGNNQDSQNEVIVVQKKIGSVNIERSGLAYFLEEETKLRDGDIIETLNGSSVEISIGDSLIYLDENSELLISIMDEGPMFTLNQGGVFIDSEQKLKFSLHEKEITTEKGVFSANALFGSANIYVFDENVIVSGEEVIEGKAINILYDGTHIFPLSIQALNSFQLEKVKETNESKTLCFSKTDVKNLLKEREESIILAQNSQKLEEQADAFEAQRQENQNTNKFNIDENNSVETGGLTTENNSGENAENETVDKSLSCTITIRCDTILDNMENLEEGKDKYVPSNGTILATISLTFSEGETVFDVLKRACDLAGIQIEYSWTPMYNSYYIEGINNLYEFDCGSQSGWMYKVNGWFPNYGCSSYTLKDGDTIVWCYTCNGLGEDVGAGSWQ